MLATISHPSKHVPTILWHNKKNQSGISAQVKRIRWGTRGKEKLYVVMASALKQCTSGRNKPAEIGTRRKE